MDEQNVSSQKGEYVQAKSIPEYWQKLKEIYIQKSKNFEEISKEVYEAIDKSEREDSDNHYNQERLGKDTDVVDIAFYKYLPDRQSCYRLHIVDINGNQEVHFFRLTLKNEAQIN